MNTDDILIMGQVTEKIFGSPCATWYDRAASSEYWRRVNRYRKADMMDIESAVTGLAAVWHCGNTRHENIMRNQFSPVEWTLMSIWPRHDEWQDVSTWHAVLSKIRVMITLSEHDGIGDIRDKIVVQRDFFLLAGLALKHIDSFNQQSANQIQG